MVARFWLQTKAFCSRLVWETELTSLSPFRARFIRLLRATDMVLRELADEQLTLRAASLVYTTLLSLVPLLAVSFSVLKAFGVHNQMEPVLFRFLEPLGEQGMEITQRVIGFVEKMRVGVLGAIGLGTLLYTVGSLIQKIEQAFNYTWRVAQPRSVLERFRNYFSVILIGPVLVFSALGITASLMSTTVVQYLAAIEPFGTAIRVLTQLVPYVLVIAAFLFVYLFIPNTRVKLSAALIGATVAAVLWQSTGWAFASFIVASTKYAAIYSSLAILILFMIWLYLSWVILLVGASIAFYYQYPEYLGLATHQKELSNRLKERLALLTAVLIGQRHLGGGQPWTAEALSQWLKIPRAHLQSILDTLAHQGMLVQTRQEPPAYLPAKDPSSIPLQAILDGIRAAGEDSHLNLRRLPPEPTVDALALELEQATTMALRNRTLRDVLAVNSQAMAPAAASPPANVQKALNHKLPP